MPGIPPIIEGLHQDAISTKFTAATGYGSGNDSTRRVEDPDVGSALIKTLLDPNLAWARATSGELQNVIYHIPDITTLAGTENYVLKNGAAFASGSGLY